MDVDAAVGKILGMVMAYAVSFLGLLLAYYNHRKRAGKVTLELPHVIERAPEPSAKPPEEAQAEGALLHPGPWLVMGLVATVLVLIAAAYSGDYPSAGAAILAQLPGIIVPGIVFAASFWVTWALYRKFAGGSR